MSATMIRVAACALLLLLLAFLGPPGILAASQPNASASGIPFGDSAADLWVLLVGTSRNWLNYRDNSNTIALYRMFRRLGVPDSNIIVMLGHSMACDPRNPHPGQLYVDPDHAWDLYQEPIEVDYRGADVTVESFLRVVTGFHFPGTPKSKQLRSHANSLVFMYLTGHGGDKFLKFQDKEELQAHDLANALHQMHLQRRYGSVLLMADTCQAGTMLSQLRSPGIVGIASSAKGENSYSYLPDSDLGVSVVDRFTFTLLNFVEGAVRAAADASSLPGHVERPSSSLQTLFDTFDRNFLQATPIIRSDLSPLPVEKIPALQYFVWPTLLPGSGKASSPEDGQLNAAAESAAVDIARQAGVSFMAKDWPCCSTGLSDGANKMGAREGSSPSLGLDWRGEGCFEWSSDFMLQWDAEDSSRVGFSGSDQIDTSEITMNGNSDLVNVILLVWLALLAAATSVSLLQ